MIENIVWKQDLYKVYIGSKWVFIFASKNDIDSDINLMKKVVSTSNWFLGWTQVWQGGGREWRVSFLPHKKGGGKCHLHWSKLVLGQQQQPLQNVTNIGMWHCGHQSWWLAFTIRWYVFAIQYNVREHILHTTYTHNMVDISVGANCANRWQLDFETVI